jgi:hypothetical protein
MRYYEFLELPEVKDALSASLTDTVPHLLEDHVFKGSFLDDEKIKKQFIEEMIVIEIDARKKYLAHQKNMGELNEKMEPYRQRDEKIKAIRPVVAQFMEGNFLPPFDKSEDAIINYVSEKVVDKYGEQLGVDDTGQAINSRPRVGDNSGLSELEKLLQSASITFLETSMSPQEMTLHTIHDRGIGSWLK